MGPSSSSSVLFDQDLLREIFLRLPWPACLVLAALVCRAWRNVVSDTAFLSLFRSRHPSILGFLHHRFSTDGRPAFTRALPMPDGVADPFLSKVESALGMLLPFRGQNWSIRDAFDGRALLFCTSSEFLLIAVSDPLTGSFLVLPTPAAGANNNGSSNLSDELEFLNPSSMLQEERYDVDANFLSHRSGDGVPWASAFRVVLLVTRLADRKMGAWMYSADAGSWSLLNFILLPELLQFEAGTITPWMDGLFLLSRARSVLAIDAGKRQLSVIELPAALRERYGGNMELVGTTHQDGALGVVGLEGNHFHLWLRRQALEAVDAPEQQRWVLRWDVDATAAVRREMALQGSEQGVADGRLRMCGIGEMDGLVFARSRSLAGEILSLNMHTLQVSKVENGSGCRGTLFPLAMPSPRFR